MEAAEVVAVAAVLIAVVGVVVEPMASTSMMMALQRQASDWRSELGSYLMEPRDRRTSMAEQRVVPFCLAPACVMDSGASTAVQARQTSAVFHRFPRA